MTRLEHPQDPQIEQVLNLSESQIPQEAMDKFYRAGYRIVGSHSAVEICYWTKQSLRRNRVCYKQKWYGIKSHRCMEMTPALIWCTHSCEFCWRPLEFTSKGEPKPDEPSEIIDGCIAARRQLLTRFGSREGVDRGKWRKALTPSSVAISLAGEPLLYLRISELIEEFRKRGMTSFLVTNGTRPDRLRSLTKEPTSLYISLCAPNAETYVKVNRPLTADGWIRLNKSLELMKSLSCRTVLRLTLVKGLNFFSPEKYAKLILKSEPDFVEAKSYSWIGESRRRLPSSSAIPLEALKEFAQAVARGASYMLKDVDSASRVALLAKG